MDGACRRPSLSLITDTYSISLVHSLADSHFSLYPFFALSLSIATCSYAL
jgi:hypothetical protein